MKVQRVKRAEENAKHASSKANTCSNEKLKRKFQQKADEALVAVGRAKTKYRRRQDSDWRQERPQGLKR